MLSDYASAMILWRTGSSDVVRSIESCIARLRDENYMEFVRCNLAILEAPPDEHLPHVASVLMMREVRMDCFYRYFDDAWGLIVSKVPAILANEKLPVLVRENVVSVIANVCARVWESKNISESVLGLVSNPGMERFAYACVAEVMEEKGGFCGFPVGAVQDLIARECCFVERFRLYLAVVAASGVGGDILPNMLKSIAGDGLDQSLRLLDSFCRHHGRIVADVLLAITDFLIGIAETEDQSDEIRNWAMYCLASISEGAKDSCMASQEFCEKSLLCLMKVAAQVSDDFSCEFDPNDTKPCVEALDVISSISENCASKYFMECAETFIEDAKQSWQTMYALLMGVSEFSGPCFGDLMYVSNGRLAKWTELAVAHLDKDPPVLRYAVWKILKAFSKHLQNIFQNATVKNIVTCFATGLSVETDMRVRREILRSFAAYFDVGLLPFTSTDGTRDSYENACVLNMKLLESPDPQDLKLVVPSSAFFIRTCPQDSSIFPNIVKCLMDIFDKYTDQDDLRITILYTLSKSSHYTSRIPVELSKRILYEAWGLLSHCPDEASRHYCQKTVIPLIRFLGSQGNHVFRSAFQYALECTIQELDVKTFTKYEESQFAARDLYLCVPSVRVDSYLFVQKDCITEVKFGLSLLAALCDGIGVPILEHIDKITYIVIHWLTNNAQISKLLRGSWSLLTRIIALATKHNSNCRLSGQKQVDISSLFVFSFDSFCAQLQKVDLKLDLEMLKSMCVILLQASNMHWNDHYRLLRLMEVISNYGDTLFTKLDHIKSFVDHELKGGESEEAMLCSQISHNLASILDIWKRLFITHTETTNKYFMESMHTKCQNTHLSSITSAGFGAQLLGYFYSQSKSPIDHVTTTIYKLLVIGTDKNLATGTEFMKTASIDALRSIGMIAGKYTFPPDQLQSLFMHLAEFCNDLIIQNSTSVSDMALFVLTTLIRRNPDVLATREGISLWFSCFPVWNPYIPYTNRIFLYLAELLEQHQPELLEPEVIEEWISYVCPVLGCNFMSSDTESRFIKLISALLTSSLKEPVAEALSLLNPKIQEKIHAILS